MELCFSYQILYYRNTLCSIDVVSTRSNFLIPEHETAITATISNARVKIFFILLMLFVLWYRVLHLTKSIYSTEQFTFRLRYQQPEMRPSGYTTISRSRLSGSSSSIRRSSPILLCDRVISTVIQPRRLHGKGHYVQEQYKARQKNTALYYKSEGNH